MWLWVPGVVPGSGPGPPIDPSLSPARASSPRTPGIRVSTAPAADAACVTREAGPNQPR